MITLVRAAIVLSMIPPKTSCICSAWVLPGMLNSIHSSKINWHAKLLLPKVILGMYVRMCPRNRQRVSQMCHWVFCVFGWCCNIFWWTSQQVLWVPDGLWGPGKMLVWLLTGQLVHSYRHSQITFPVACCRGHQVPVFSKGGVMGLFPNNAF